MKSGKRKNRITVKKKTDTKQTTQKTDKTRSRISFFFCTQKFFFGGGIKFLLFMLKFVMEF